MATPELKSGLAAPGASYATKTETIDQASPEVLALVSHLNRFAQASTLEQHREALKFCDEDVTLDTPFIQIQGRERVRVLAALTKYFLGTFNIEGRLVRIRVPEGGKPAKSGWLEVDGVVHWQPNRPWYLPLTWLLPQDVPIYSDVSLGIKAHNDKVFSISGKNHNLPHVPRILRILAGMAAGMTVSIAEPVVLQLRDWYLASVEGAASVASNLTQTAARAGETIKEGATGAVESARETVAPVVERVAERVPAVGKVAETAGMRATVPPPTARTTAGAA